MSSVQLRRVDALLPRDPHAALAVARSIDDPWARCQALAAVAEHLGGRDRTGVLRESFKAADAAPNPNRIVTVAAWPLAVLVRAGDAGPAHRQLERLAAIIESEPNPVSRMDGWAMLYLAVEPVPALREQAYPPFLAAIRRVYGWKGDRTLGWLAAHREAVEPGSGETLLAMIRRPRMQRRARKKLQPRPDTPA